VAAVSIADASPIDRNSDNDEARIVVRVTEARSSAPIQELSAPGAVAVAVEDFDGDGRDDLAVATGAGEPTMIFLNAADPNSADAGPFTSLAVSTDDSSEAAAIAAGDLDGDGSADLVVANSDGPNHVLFNNGSAGFETTALESGAGASNAVAMADVDGDGLLDVVFANEGMNTVHRNLGSRQFTAGEDVGEGPSTGVAAADLAGDSRPELVFANLDADAGVYSRADVSYANTASLETGPATSVAAIDFDADGADDLAFGRSASADLVFLNTSGGTASFSVAERLADSHTVGLLLGDFDADGRNDIVAIGAAGTHRLYTSGGSAGTAFMPHPEQFAGKAATGGALGRFDADGAPDVAVAGSDVVAIFLNDGRGNFGGGIAGMPRLTLNGEPTVFVTVGDAYEDAGATAIDDVDGDLTEHIVVDNPVDTDVIGAYTVTYEVEDSSGNRATATRTVEVQARSGSGGGGGAVGPILLLLFSLAAAVRGRSSRAALWR